MDPTPGVIWQIGSGPTDRSYADVFLRYGVALLGPGDTGPLEGGRIEAAPEDERYLRWFSREIAVGDSLLLRSGQTKVRAVGIVASEYQYLEPFDDVNGWDLRHARRVRWLELPQEYDFGRAVFGANPPRLSRVQEPDIRNYALQMIRSPPFSWQTSVLPKLPDIEPPLEKVPEGLELIVAEAQDLAPLSRDEARFGDLPSEDELIVHLVVPLLKALGWKSEQIAVQWKNVDVAVFSRLPRTPSNCQFVIEAKRFGSALEGAFGQAKEYVDSLGTHCDIVLTDGVRYQLYSYKENYRRVAYANLERLKRSSVYLFSQMHNGGRG